VGTRIDQAIRDLEARANDELRASADAWLTEAKGALVERNSVIHSMPATWMLLSPDPDTPAAEKGPFLMHYPRNRDLPVVHTALTIDGLQPIRERLEAARVGWIDLASELWERRARG